MECTTHTATKTKTKTHTKEVKVKAISPYGEGDISCDPDQLHVDRRNTNIVFVFHHNTPADVIFTGFRSDDSKKQLGAPVISEKGRRMEVFDLDSEPGIIHYWVECKNGAGKKFEHDPQIINDPQEQTGG